MLKSFDLKVEGDLYIAECGYQPPPSPTPVELRYTQADLRELSALGDEQRGKSGPTKEFLSQVQILRTIGGYLDRNRVTLLRITNNLARSGEDFSLRVEYLGVDGDQIVDDRAGAAIYDLCIAMYKQRKKLTGTGGWGR
ncbi:MAG: hypothetical protein ACREQO_05385 [Candidatus Binatia bacterium]